MSKESRAWDTGFVRNVLETGLVPALKAGMKPTIAFLGVCGTRRPREVVCARALAAKVSDGRFLKEFSANRSRPPLDCEGWCCGIIADALADAISSARFLSIPQAIAHNPEGRLMHHAQNDVGSY